MRSSSNVSAGCRGSSEASAGLMDVVSFPDRDLYGVIVQGLRTDSKTVLGLEMVSG